MLIINPFKILKCMYSAFSTYANLPLKNITRQNNPPTKIQPLKNDEVKTTKYLPLSLPCISVTTSRLSCFDQPLSPTNPFYKGR